MLRSLKMETQGRHHLIAPDPTLSRRMVLCSGPLAFSLIRIPLRAADPTESQLRFSGALDDKDDFGSSSGVIVERSKVSIMNAVRTKLSARSAVEVNLRFAKSLSIKTEGVPREEWQAALIAELSRAVEKLLKETQEDLDWPSIHFSVEGEATPKLATGGKALEFPGKPTVRLVGTSFPDQSSSPGHTGEAGPLRLRYKLLDASATLEEIRWHGNRKPGSLSDGTPLLASFEPRYFLKFEFALSLTDSTEQILGGGSIAFWGATRTLELRSAPKEASGR